ncbi:MAG: hypothetical protein PVS3B3_30570 [Ktedonobacteraceae bacterium]
MSISHIQRSMALCAIALCLCVLAACSSGSVATSEATPIPTPKATSGASSTAIVVTSVPSTPGIGPTVILSPTPVPGGGAHSQQVVLTDRTLIINDVSKSSGSDANSTAITMMMTMKNTSAKAITNQPSYFSLFGTEGDVFGLAANTTGSFFGSIDANSSRSGTVVFQVPTGATKTLKLFYRSNVANETVFVPFNV